MDCATARPDLIHAKPNSAYHMRGGRGVAGGLCYWTCTSLKHRFNYDDSLDVFGLHGVGGMTGTLLCGVFATASIGGTPRPDRGPRNLHHSVTFVRSR
jgi:ammonia channel protein AmtB